jgi:hypothetical protein
VDNAARHDRWIVNKLRALVPYYTKGFDGGGRLRTAVNTTSSLDELRTLIATFFAEQSESARSAQSLTSI